MTFIYRDERGVHAGTHPDVAPYIGCRRDARGLCVALFMRSANEERRMQNGFRPYHTIAMGKADIQKRMAELPATRDREAARLQQAEYETALAALAAPVPAANKPRRFYCRWGLNPLAKPYSVA